MAGDGVSGWRLDCPACGAGYLLPDALARSGARVRCPGCHHVFSAADPVDVGRAEQAVAVWAASRPGGLAALRDARAGGRFWAEHGEPLVALFERGEGAVPAEAFRAALARVLGPGRPLF